MAFPSKVVLVARIWGTYLTMLFSVRRYPLPDIVTRLARSRVTASVHVHPKRLGAIVYRVLHVGPWRPRCLFTSLVLFRLLREQGDDAEFVIGLPQEPRDKDAHAWVEIDARDVGPPPGGRGHRALARFGKDLEGDARKRG